MKLKLKEIRKQYGLKQENVADYLQISRPTYCRYETGQREPNIETIYKIADLYKVPIDTLFGRMAPQTKLDKIIDKLTPEEREKAAQILEAAFNKE